MRIRRSSSSPLEVVSLHQTCWACPSQWEGRLADGRGLYIRYRWSTLTVSAGSGPRLTEEWVEIYRKGDGTGWDGILSDSDMMMELSGILDFSHCQWKDSSVSACQNYGPELWDVFNKGGVYDE